MPTDPTFQERRMSEAEQWFHQHNKPWWARRSRARWPRKLKICYWASMALAVVSLGFLPLALIAIPALLAAVVWHIAWMVSVRRG